MWGKPDLGDRIAQLLVGMAALIALANGLFMLIDPLGWYEAVGTVKATGPANSHFLRDIGIAYLCSGGLLTYAALNLPMRWGSALAGGAWLAFHGALHVWEVSKGICGPGIFWQEAPGTLGPPLLVLAGIGLQLFRKRISPAPLPKAIFIPFADKMTGGLSPYFGDLAAAPGFLTEKYQHFLPLALHRHSTALDQVTMVRLGALRVEDCGPCSLIVAYGALSEGLPRDLINAALAGHPPEGPLGQAYAFGQAIAAGSADADALGDAIEAEQGRAVRTELSFAAASVRIYPAVKCGLGYAQSCAVTQLKV
jgi:hypothetical protein